MSEIKFSKEEIEVISLKIQNYFREELDQEIGQFEVQFLLVFLAKEIGPYFYNRGLYDAQAILLNRMDNITEAIYDIEKVTKFRK